MSNLLFLALLAGCTLIMAAILLGLEKLIDRAAAARRRRMLHQITQDRRPRR